MNTINPQQLHQINSCIWEHVAALSLQPSHADYPEDHTELEHYVHVDIGGGKGQMVLMGAHNSIATLLASTMFDCFPSELDDADITDALSEATNMLASKVTAAIGVEEPVGIPRYIDADQMADFWGHVDIDVETSELYDDSHVYIAILTINTKPEEE